MIKYKECKICGLTFPYTTGKFTIHLMEEHNITLRDYIIKYELCGNIPKCQCGYCDEDAPFFRGKFLARIGDHQKYDWLKEQYIKKYGKPTCKTCGKDVKWHRGIPNIYCSIKCQPSNWNQEKINITVKEKYGVDNISYLNDIKSKISIKKKESYTLNKNNIVNKFKDTCLMKFGVDSFSKTDLFLEKSKISYMKTLGVDHPSRTLQFRQDSSLRMIKNNSEFNFTNCYKIKKYKETELYYQSLYEYDFLEYCEKIDILELIDNGHVYNFSENDYDYGLRTITDFCIEDIGLEIEIKSTYILEKQGGQKVIDIKKESVESQDWKYLLILDKDYSEFEKIIKDLK